MTPNDLLDLARAAINGTDADLARKINSSRKTLHGWKTGYRPIPDNKVISLANLANLDPAQTLAEISAAQAGTAHPEVAQTWAEIARRVANPNQTGQTPEPSNLYIMSTHRNRWGQCKPSRLWGWIKATDPLPTAA